MKKIVISAALLSLFVLSSMSSVPALAMSNEWRKTIDSRTALIWVDGQVLGNMVLNARAKLFVTWLPLSLRTKLDRDRDVDEWVINGLGYYYSRDTDVKAMMKGRDIIALNYATQKSWHFDPTELSIGDYHVTAADVLGHPELRGPAGDLPSGVNGTLFICVPSMKPGKSVKISIGQDSAVLELPKR